MERPTVIDIARAAGVSLATVDRVLNDRPGVRRQTIDKVREAVERLGYQRDLAAADLARRRSYRLAFVLPNGAGEAQSALRRAAREAARAAEKDRTRIEVRTFPGDDAHALAAMLTALAAPAPNGERLDGVALNAPETPLARDAARALRAAGVAVAAIVSDLPSAERDSFVGVDNLAAGRTAGVLMGRFVGAKGGRVVMAADSLLLRESIERRLGFDGVLAAGFPGVRALPSIEGWGDPAQTARAIAAQLAAHPDVEGVYCMGADVAAILATLRRLRPPERWPVVIAHDLTTTTRRGLESGEIAAVIAQDFGHIARSAVRTLRALSGGAPVDPAQERIRIEIVIRENLPPEG